jgi:peptidoglycan/xylan/chitin deacetylase (PgdA/CDA1 family)
MFSARMSRSVPAPVRLLKRAAGRGLRSIVSVEPRGQPVVALTFDDGPGPYTDAVLDLLERHRARATFFVVGRKVAARRGVLRQACDAGHAIGNHTFSHRRLPSLGLRAVWREIRDGRRTIEDAIGARVSLFRPPFGEQTRQSVLLARLLGHDVICWSSSGDDWARATAPLICDRIRASMRPGAIVLLHDDVEEGDEAAPRDPMTTVRALELLLEHLGDAGIRAVTVPDLLALGRPRRVAWLHSTG